jgi:pteridine reductase
MSDGEQRRIDVFGTPDPVALVTGSGAKRVGHAIAWMLARHGYRLAIHANRSHDEARDTVRSMGKENATAIALQADLTSERSARDLIDEVVTKFGRIDVLVNAAAVWPQKRLEQVTADDVRQCFEINTVSTFVCAQQAGMVMVGQERGGVIINVGDWAIARPYLDYAAYFPSKGAIPTLTRTLAVELAQRNPRVRVNAVLPGPVMLPPDLPADEREKAVQGTLVKREGTPEHVADAVLFLAENDFVTGVCLPVDGGRTVYAP